MKRYFLSLTASILSLIAFHSSELRAAAFTDWDKAMADPKAVTELQLGDDAVAPTWKSLPAGLDKLTNLQILRLNCMEKLQSLPASLGELKNLKVISIDNGNGCASNVGFPDSIGHLPALRELSIYGGLDGAPAKALPASIGQIKTLEVLDLGRNSLGQVPAFVASLSGLKTLKLDYDNLTALPDSLGNLKSLQELSLVGNTVKRLPTSLAAIAGLKIYMGNNSLKKADQAALRKNFPKAVFSFENDMDDGAANQ